MDSSEKPVETSSGTVARRGGARPGAGRKPDAQSRTTRASREAIAAFVHQNIPRLNGWLEQVANGLPKLDREGEPLRDDKGSVVWVVKPDAMGAVKIVSDIMDYHLPRLQRSDVTVLAQVESGASLELAERVKKMSTADLKLALAASMEQQGMSWDSVEIDDPLADNVTDVVSRVVPDEPVVPEWMRSDPENASD